jgi:NhaA family Na+:H+ antiporter
VLPALNLSPSPNRDAGVPLGGGIAEVLANPVVLGIVGGLVVGKQVGVTLFAWLAVKSRVSELPTGVNWRYVYGGGWWRVSASR